METSAGIISYNQKTEVAFLQIDVRLKRKNIESVSDLPCTGERFRLELSGSPKVTRSGDVFSADRIAVDLETEYISLDGSVSGTLESTAESPSSGEAGESSAGEPAGSGMTESSAGELAADDALSGNDTPETGEGTDDE